MVENLEIFFKNLKSLKNPKISKQNRWKNGQISNFQNLQRYFWVTCISTRSIVPCQNWKHFDVPSRQIGSTRGNVNLNRYSNQKRNDFNETYFLKQCKDLLGLQLTFQGSSHGQNYWLLLPIGCQSNNLTTWGCHGHQLSSYEFLPLPGKDRRGVERTE